MSWFKRSAQNHIPQTSEDRLRNELLGVNNNSSNTTFDRSSSAQSVRPPSYHTVDERNDEVDPLRAELFASNRRNNINNYNSTGGGITSSAYEGIEEEDSGVANDDEEVEAIKQQTRYTKEESKESTRNALRIARETEENATNTMMKLGDQSG